MMGNYHVRFLGGKGVVTPLTYPVFENRIMSMFCKHTKKPISEEGVPEPVKEAAKAALRRYLVIGSSGYRGVDSVDWQSTALPNIVDYDTVIVDVRSLDEDTLKVVSHNFLLEIRTQLIRLLDSGGEIIVLTYRGQVFV